MKHQSRDNDYGKDKIIPVITTVQRKLYLQMIKQLKSSDRNWVDKKLRDAGSKFWRG